MERVRSPLAPHCGWCGEERERCAKVAEDYAVAPMGEGECAIAYAIADSIRRQP